MTMAVTVHIITLCLVTFVMVPTPSSAIPFTSIPSSSTPSSASSKMLTHATSGTTSTFTENNNIQTVIRDSPTTVSRESTETVKETESTPRDQGQVPHSPIPNTELGKCVYHFTSQDIGYLYYINQRFVHTVFLRFSFPSQPRCYMTRHDIESKLNETTELVADFSFSCKNSGVDIVFVDADTEGNFSQSSASSSDPAKQFMKTPTLKPYNHYISYFDVVGCRVNLVGASIVADLTDLRVVSFIGTNSLDFGELQQTPELCDVFEKVVSLFTIYDFNLHNHLHHLAICGGLLDNLVEVTIYNGSLASFPDALLKAAPHLQSIEIKNCSLNKPVDFGPGPGIFKLPRNLSRTFEQILTYDFDESIDIQSDEFRKVQILDGNKIKNLTHYQFRGELQAISLERNGLEQISDETFNNVTNLQYLNLAYNNLENLPMNLFSANNKLKRLDVQGNRLTSLANATFQNLLCLSRLNLAQNRLVSLQDGVFTSLERLTSLHLQNNRIIHISNDAFTKRSLKLKTINLQNNPLKTFPAAVLGLRGLLLLNLDSTDIEVLDFTDMSRHHEVPVYADDVFSTGAEDFGNLGRGPYKVISLRHSKFQSVVVYNDTKETLTMFHIFVRLYQVLLEGSALRCDCRILNFTHQILEWQEDGTLTRNLPSLAPWTCKWPEELLGRNVLNLREYETYCPLDTAGNGNESCPQFCTCYVRTGVRSTIVDCRHRGLTVMPRWVPTNTRELWLQNNSISTLDNLPYLTRLHILKMNANQVRHVPQGLAQLAAKLKVLHLHDNLLTGLDPSFGDFSRLSDVQLSGNPFRCDCHVLWLKNWLSVNQDTVKDWSEIKCSTDRAEGQVLIVVPDSLFTCPALVSLRQLALPLALSLTSAFLLLTSCVVAYLQRRRLKVWLYIHTSLHLFDRDPPHHRAKYDVSICCDVTARDWVLHHVVTPLEEDRKYKVFFYSRDAYPGFSVVENVSYCVKHSRRLVLVLDRPCWQQSELLLTAVRQAVDRCRRDVVHFLTLILHHVSARHIHHKDIQTYIRRGRYIHTEDRHFFRKLLYEMPHLKKTQDKRVSSESNADPVRVIVYSKHVQGLVDNLQEKEDEEELEVVVDDIEIITENEHNSAENTKTRRKERLNTANNSNNDFGKFSSEQTQSMIDRAEEERHSINDGTIRRQFFQNVNGNLPTAHEHIQNTRSKVPTCPQTQPAQNDNELCRWEVCEQSNKMQQNCRKQETLEDGTASQFQRSTNFEIHEQNPSVFVWYADKDLPFTLRKIVEPVERQGHRCVLQDRDFQPGAAIQENIVNAAQMCQFSVFVLSDHTSQTEWFTFAFLVAFDRHVQSRDTHRVLLVKRQDVDVTLFAEEVQQALKTSEPLCERDPWFGQKLEKFLDFAETDLR